MVTKRSWRWGAVGSAVVLSLALGAGCGGDDDDASGGSDDAQGQTADPGLDQRQEVIDHLAGVSQSYSSGDAAAAEDHLGEAQAAWSEASATFPEAEASAIEGQIEALASQVAGSAPAEEITDAIETLNTELAAGPDATG